MVRWRSAGWPRVLGCGGSVVTAEECPADSGEDGADSAGGVPEGYAGDTHPGPARCPVRGRLVRRAVSLRRQAGAVTRTTRAAVRAAVHGGPLRPCGGGCGPYQDRYALGLELEDPGFDHSVLCEFRARLAEQDGVADQLLALMLERLVDAGLLKAGGRQRTDTTHVLAAVHASNGTPPGADLPDGCRLWTGVGVRA
ncbi:transposase [Streptomyces carpinensis]|uniref:Transposase n=1 Tax=Streptomyces carpinensis TaxID=66369 RepID=A0ABV1W682_9ACTN|nr:transposase [Streptomyces carpinensis]